MQNTTEDEPLSLSSIKRQKARTSPLAEITPPGCVFELVPLAHQFGFYWGGHFKTRRDGMHFEVAKPLTQPEVDQVLAKL